MIGLMRIGGSADVFFLHGDYSFSSVGSCHYSMEWVWKSTTKLSCMASIQEFDISYIMF